MARVGNRIARFGARQADLIPFIKRVPKYFFKLQIGSDPGWFIVWDWFSVFLALGGVADKGRDRSGYRYDGGWKSGYFSDIYSGSFKFCHGL